MTGDSNRRTPPAASNTMERLKRKTGMLMWTKRVEYLDWSLNCSTGMNKRACIFRCYVTIKIKIEAL